MICRKKKMVIFHRYMFSFTSFDQRMNVKTHVLFSSIRLQGREAPLPLGVLQEVAQAMVPRPAGLMIHDLANASKASGKMGSK